MRVACTFSPESSSCLFSFNVTLSALVLTSLLPIAAQASDESQLVSMINRYRAAPQMCDGKRTGPLQPLASSKPLSQVKIGAWTPLRTALQEVGYNAVRVKTIDVPASDPAAALRSLQRSYCQSLLSTQYSNIGISRRGRSWQVVLAQPIVSASLAGWQTTGREILKRVNEARAKPRTCGAKRFAAAPPLRWNAKLGQAAFAHSREMATFNYFSHTGKGGSKVGERAREEGYLWRRIGENIFAGSGSAREAVAGWLASPGHCANIMDPHYTDMGAAYVMNPKSTNVIYWTQVFGAPR
ncbi:Cysteine-rich secretory protein family protein [Pseudomonas duriflava]|uniref:Cysteine-rich secretory protein family protein n=1 Tax=Pseudomonas duriflava TaxID=459528 RepID=A0A562QLM5_9PSED|nr:CAP domain-containing protein [Pseudomonas duriflava]TWI57615.1 Cysteine-rich secretory protein family protein [Pseudomonas duriflava]